MIGHPAATAALARAAKGLPPGCASKVERSDSHLVSVVWRCGRSVSAATVTLAGRTLSLGDILTGSYARYLSSAASAQFSVEGISNPATADLGTWYLTPAALAVVYPPGIVSYPLASLGPYLRDQTSL